MNSNLYIYTSNYPFSKTSETFLGPEIVFARDYFKKVTIIPVNGDSYKRSVPDGIIVDETLVRRTLWTSLRAIIGLFSKRVLKIDKQSLPASLSDYIDAIKYFYAANLVYFDLCKRLINIEGPVVLYSYWLSYPPIAFVWIKEKFEHKKIRAVARAHGSDIYTTDVGVYYPKRGLVMDKMDAIYPVSSYGMHYLKKKYNGLTPITVSRLGVFDNHSSTTKQEGFIYLVSCASVIPLKRVDLLFRSLNNFAADHSDVNIDWTHYGGGPLFEVIQEISSSHQTNLKIHLVGTVSNSEILKVYRERFFDCYLLVSESEGIPVSIMEALASGIPVISTNVGGVSEIVNSETGCLLNKNFSQEEFNEALNRVVNTPSLRESSYSFFKNNYEAGLNYKDFYRQISRLVQD